MTLDVGSDVLSKLTGRLRKVGSAHSAVVGRKQAIRLSPARPDIRVVSQFAADRRIFSPITAIESIALGEPSAHSKPQFESSSCSGPYRVAASTGPECPISLLSSLGQFSQCVRSRAALPPTATLYLSRSCSTTYKIHRLARRAASLKSAYLKRPCLTTAIA